MQRPRTRAWRLTRVALAAGAVALVSGASTAVSAAASTPRASSSGNGMPDLSAFKGKTITIIAPDAPGGDYDLYARALAPGLAQELDATVNVTNVAGAGTVEGSNELWSAAPNGLTLGFVSVGGDIASLVEHQPGQNFNMRKFSWIGQPGNSPDVLCVQPKSDYKLFTEMLHAKNPISVDDIRNGVGDMLNRVVFGAFHIPHTFITGYTGTSSLKQGFLAGDGTSMLENIPTLLPLLQAGQATPILLTAEPAPVPRDLRDAVKNVPTLAQELSSSKVKLTKSERAAVDEAISLAGLAYDFSAPPGMSKSMLETLRTAFEKALKLPVVKAQALKESEPLQPISGVQLNKDVTTALRGASVIGTYVNASS